MDEIKIPEFDEQRAQEQLKEKMDKVMAAQSEWFKTIEELKSLISEWPNIDEIIPRLNGLEGDERALFDKVMRARQAIDGGIVFSLRQALVRYGNLLFL